MRAPARHRAVLLDTCAVIYFANGDAMANPAVEAIIQAGGADGVYVSPVSAWEIGLLSRPGRPNTVHFLPDPKTWFARVLETPANQAGRVHARDRNRQRVSAVAAAR